MLKSLSLFLIWIFLFISIFVGSVFLEKSFFFAKKRLFYTPPLDYLKIISGTFSSFYADIFYIRGVLAITDDIENRDLWVNWVQKNFEVSINLDPKLTQAYFFAGLVVAQDEKSIRKGIDFLEKGLRLNPDEWQIPYWIGFNYYQLGDYLRAVKFFQKASELPTAPNFLKSVQPVYYYRAGRPDLALSYLEGLLHSVKDPKQLEWIEIKLKWSKDITYLEQKVKEFRKIYGRLPQRLEELTDKRLIEKVPKDPFGNGYYLDKGRVKSRFGVSNRVE